MASSDGTPLTGLSDVRVLAFLAPGVWQQRSWAVEEADGVYQITFEPPRTGVYYLYVEVASLGFGLDNPQYVILRVTEDASRPQ